MKNLHQLKVVASVFDKFVPASWRARDPSQPVGSPVCLPVCLPACVPHDTYISHLSCNTATELAIQLYEAISDKGGRHGGRGHSQVS